MSIQESLAPGTAAYRRSVNLTGLRASLDPGTFLSPLRLGEVATQGPSLTWPKAERLVGAQGFEGPDAIELESRRDHLGRPRARRAGQPTRHLDRIGRVLQLQNQGRGQSGDEGTVAAQGFLCKLKGDVANTPARRPNLGTPLLRHLSNEDRSYDYQHTQQRRVPG
jgi:hypothetical protein